MVRSFQGRPSLLDCNEGRLLRVDGGQEARRYHGNKRPGCCYLNDLGPNLQDTKTGAGMQQPELEPKQAGPAAHSVCAVLNLPNQHQHGPNTHHPYSTPVAFVSPLPLCTAVAHAAVAVHIVRHRCPLIAPGHASPASNAPLLQNKDAVANLSLPPPCLSCCNILEGVKLRVNTHAA